MKKKHVFFIALVLFILTNPTNSDFQSYLKSKSYSDLEIKRSGKRSYFLIGSLYACGGETYIGLFKNFFRVDNIQGPSEEEKSSAQKTGQDSISAAEQAAAETQEALQDSSSKIQNSLSSENDSLSILNSKPKFDPSKPYEAVSYKDSNGVWMPINVLDEFNTDGLKPQFKTRLIRIISEMQANKETCANVRLVIKDFTKKYSGK